MAQWYRLLISGCAGRKDDAGDRATILFDIDRRRLAVAHDPGLIDPNDTAGV
jgi:hypothetical protein